MILLFYANSYATWSIIAVDRKTGEIGIAGASCTFDVSGIASIEPGKGAIVVQAASNYFARMEGVSLLENNASIQEILDAMMADRFDPERQQYGVILLKDGTSPLVYSGTEIKDWNGEMIDDDFAVMGNILLGEQVVKKAFEAFNQNRDKSLAERLVIALKAGEESGGDARCGNQYARSAFIMIYQPVHGAILKLAVQGIEKGKKPAVGLLNEQFKLWYKTEE
ncbi:DUF1028 domain-containing protein [Croceitalea rosinachiae]|uniref:DUF1028 domain-containing protein n=1 Tax=Croceitalea rosinachiae TaxID=3075596 RepID=A0ABU3A7Q8_9FLAO|nr:DUF1028 domain-containing protein [Croceitalea sp. F388]MDT0605925.1 DUF1028 domain-containing protein [Croceitalea sp. F388]